MLESLFNKVAGLNASNFIEKRLAQVFSSECKFFKKSFFHNTLPAFALSLYFLNNSH